MATMRFTLMWEEDDPMTYDEFMDHLMHLGAMTSLMRWWKQRSSRLS